MLCCILLRHSFRCITCIRFVRFIDCVTHMYVPFGNSASCFVFSFICAAAAPPFRALFLRPSAINTAQAESIDRPIEGDASTEPSLHPILPSHKIAASRPTNNNAQMATPKTLVRSQLMHHFRLIPSPAIDSPFRQRERTQYQQHHTRTSCLRVCFYVLFYFQMRFTQPQSEHGYSPQVTGEYQPVNVF